MAPRSNIEKPKDRKVKRQKSQKTEKPKDRRYGNNRNKKGPTAIYF